MRAATVVQQLCKSCRTGFKFYCMFYFTCDLPLMSTSNIPFYYHSARKLIVIVTLSYVVAVNSIVDLLAAHNHVCLSRCLLNLYNLQSENSLYSSEYHEMTRRRCILSYLFLVWMLFSAKLMQHIRIDLRLHVIYDKNIIRHLLYVAITSEQVNEKSKHSLLDLRVGLAYIISVIRSFCNFYAA